MNLNITKLLRGAMPLVLLLLAACGGGATTATPDITAPITKVAPAVSGTTATATTLSVTIDENGTGYYLVQAAASAVPATSALQAGTSFAMTANVAATPAISGLTAGTAYTIYFVAKDAANNVQAAVQSVAVTTASYVSQGGLTWMPVTTMDTWTNASAYCANTTINGLTGWRQPTQPELSALQTSGAMNNQGWTLLHTWSSTPFSIGHSIVRMDNGFVGWFDDMLNLVYVSCVRSNIPVANAGVAQNVTTGAVVTLDGSASSDPNGDPLTYSWTLTSTPLGSTSALTGATSVAPTFTADLPGTYIASLVVNDGALNSTAATVTITGLPTGYVAQGGLVWMPVTFNATWPNADAYCTSATINGLTGWRMPTQPELSALYASGAMTGQGWTLWGTWSSTVYSAGNPYAVDLNYGTVFWQSDTFGYDVSCVR
jgi:hypothetical protein